MSQAYFSFATSFSSSFIDPLGGVATLTIDIWDMFFDSVALFGHRAKYNVGLIREYLIVKTSAFRMIFFRFDSGNRTMSLTGVSLRMVSNGDSRQLNASLINLASIHSEHKKFAWLSKSRFGKNISWGYGETGHFP